MAKHKYALIGLESGAAGLPVTKELFNYEGDAIELEDGLVKIISYEEANLTVAVIRLAEGQSIKRLD